VLSGQDFPQRLELALALSDRSSALVELGGFDRQVR
jgi:hypothetical protein